MEIQLSSNVTANVPISVRPLQEADLSAADRIMRLAFGTFIGLPDPRAFMGDANYVHTRWRANPAAAFGAEVGGELVGSNFATRWGTVGFFGPLTIRPELWDKGIGKRLMEPVVECFDKWGVQHAGLFTFAHSQKHLGLYQKFGFWPRFLTAIMFKQIGASKPSDLQWTRFSEVPKEKQEEILFTCRQLTGAIYEGLDVSFEIKAVAEQGLGDTLLLWQEGMLEGLAVCHYGAGTEAGSGTLYVKFGAVRSGSSAEKDFGCLLQACEQLAAEQGLTRLLCGVNTARHEAYRLLLEQGFRTDIQGVAMQRQNEPGYNRPGIYVIDDWR